MRVGLLLLEVYLQGCTSLKDKRRVVRALRDRARARHNVAVAEVEHQDLHQRATLAYVSVAGSQTPIERMFDAIRDDAEDHVPGGISEAAREFIS